MTSADWQDEIGIALVTARDVEVHDNPAVGDLLAKAFKMILSLEERVRQLETPQDEEPLDNERVTVPEWDDEIEAPF